MKHIDVETFRLDKTLCDVPSTKPKIKSKPKIDKYYEPGTKFIASIPLTWIAEAAKLPGHTLHVALAIMYVAGMKRGKEVVLTRYHFDLFSTARGPTRRGLDALQKAGLIQYIKVGHSYKVTVLAIEP